MYKQQQDILNDSTVSLRVEADKVYIMDIADIHFGAKSFLANKLKDIINRVLSTPNMYVIIGGDSTEGSHTTSTSSLYDEDCHGYDQITGLYQLLKPLADEKRILFVRSGNHGLSRSKKTTGIAPEEVLAKFLGVPFMRGAGMVILNCNKNQYVITTWHTKKKPQNFEWIQSHVNFFEHKHLAEQQTVLFAHPNPFTKKWIVRPSVNVQCGSLLGWAGYAMDEGFRPQPTDIPVAVFSGVRNVWDFHVVSDLRHVA